MGTHIPPGVLVSFTRKPVSCNTNSLSVWKETHIRVARSLNPPGEEARICYGKEVRV